MAIPADEAPLRERRLRTERDSPNEFRTPFQRDRDRILHSSALRRLGAVTQVVPQGDEPHLLHNRLTHSLKVAQIARRLAERLRKENPDLRDPETGIDPETVEAAALAHDLGHPPFGHVAEKELDIQGKQQDLPDAFEGNAQTFRIVNKVSVRVMGHPGLNLTRGTLNAIMKYPWMRGPSGKKERKWNVYESEEVEFKWARSESPFAHLGDRKSLEAEIMDWADDIAYSVHDVEDFYRIGLIPLDRLLEDTGELEDFFRGTFDRQEEEGIQAYGREELKTAFSELLPLFPPRPFASSKRGALRTMTTMFIGRYVEAFQVKKAGELWVVEIDRELDREVLMLKELTWFYVINNPALAAQQFGQREVIRSLFHTFHDAAQKEKYLQIFPENFRDEIARIGRVQDPVEKKRRDKIRVVIDLIAGLTERQALELHRRLAGIDAGSGVRAIVG